ncbi:MAG: tyrosine-type recombinase/integrase [Chloroflexota bacterium]
MSQSNAIMLVSENDLPIRLHEYIISRSESSRRNERSRISLYEQWLVSHDMDGITQIDLAAYQRYLQSYEREERGLTALSPTSAAAHLNSIRARYLYMLDHAPSRLRDYLYSQTTSDTSPADRKAYVDEMLIRIRERVQDPHGKVHLVTRHDETDAHFIRLTYDAMTDYCLSPTLVKQNNAIAGIRDSALLSVLCMTGIREDELVNLDVRDIYQKLSGHPAIEVRRGKGAKQRVIPYGVLGDVLIQRVKAWQNTAEITSGALFRSLTKWGTVRDNRLSKRAVNDIVGRYPATYDGNRVTMKPHDCRRTYARIMRQHFGMEVDAIAANMGHVDTKTTLKYIGAVDVSSRIPRND